MSPFLGRLRLALVVVFLTTPLPTWWSMHQGVGTILTGLLFGVMAFALTAFLIWMVEGGMDLIMPKRFVPRKRLVMRANVELDVPAWKSLPPHIRRAYLQGVVSGYFIVLPFILAFAVWLDGGILSRTILLAELGLLAFTFILRPALGEPALPPPPERVPAPTPPRSTERYTW